jgi:hypothetical protein
VQLDEGDIMKNANDTARLRNQLREVNIEYSALVRGASSEDSAIRLAELSARRKSLMAHIAQASHQERAPAGLAASAAAAAVAA